MWLFTPFGFFSVVHKAGDGHLTVRARVAADLDRLRTAYLPGLSATRHTASADYPYRASASHAALAEAMAAISRAIDYANFKAEAGDRLGYARAAVYAKVWEALRELEAENPCPLPVHRQAARLRQRKRS